MKTKTSYKSTSYFATILAQTLGVKTLKTLYRGNAEEIEPILKDDGTYCTLLEKNMEKEAAEHIRKHHPTHNVICEETGSIIEGGSDYTWIIDPIDGTNVFLSGVPLYSCLVALLYKHDPVIGVIHMPALNETITAEKNKGCWFYDVWGDVSTNGKRCHVSNTDKLENATVVTSELDGFEEKPLKYLIQNTRLRTWGDGYGYSLVATGRADIMINPSMALWDAAPMKVIMEEAGGLFTDLNGYESISSGHGVATNGFPLHNEILNLLKG